MSTPYEITSTTKTTYNDPDKGIVNGVLIRFRMTAYGESGEVRVSEMSATIATKAIEKYVAERDKLAGK
jgi:hypothetical protein